MPAKYKRSSQNQNVDTRNFTVLAFSSKEGTDLVIITWKLNEERICGVLDSSFEENDFYTDLDFPLDCLENRTVWFLAMDKLGLSLSTPDNVSIITIELDDLDDKDQFNRNLVGWLTDNDNDLVYIKLNH
jgi:hypothetical protein